MSTYEIGTYYVYAKFSTAHYLQAEEYIYVLKKVNARTGQGLLELLWTVYSEGKLQSCLKSRKSQNPFCHIVETLNKNYEETIAMIWNPSI